MAITPIPEGQPMSPSTIYRRRKKAGLTTQKFKYPFDEHFFDEWSDQLAWLAGVIWTDGCLFNHSIEICSKDFQLINLIAETIGQPNGIRPKNNGQHFRIIFSSKKVADFFRTIGLTEKKSLTIGWPQIPKEYEDDFMRGVLDGDGCVHTKKDRPGQQRRDIAVSYYTASIKFKEAISAWLSEKEIKHSFRISHHTVWVISIVEQKSLHKLFNVLFPHNHIHCLHRKYSPFRFWIDTPRVRSGRPAK